MSRKTVSFKMPVNPTDPAENWVANRDNASKAEFSETALVTEPPRTVESMKRFTIDVSEELHKRIKAQCAMRGVKMADVIRDLLEREFPKTLS